MSSNQVDAHGIMVGVAGHTSRTLVGRDAELTELLTLLGVRPASVPTPAPAPAPQRKHEHGHDQRESTSLLLSGDAGVGKTRLLTELRDVAFTEGWQVFAGHCLDFGDSALPYLPFSEVLGRMATDLPTVVDTVAGAHPALARLQPGRRVMSADEGAERSALDRGDLFEAVHALLEAAAEAAPLLLVIEDTHWADQSTRDMLSFLFARPFVGPVAVVASYRSDDLHRRHPLRRQVAEWSRIRGVDRLQLSPLSATDVRTLIAELGDSLAEHEIADIVSRAEGNAFFVEELVGAASGPGRWVPDDLADVLLVRLDRVDDAARQVVRTASVSGRKVSHDMLAAASGLTEPQLDEGVRQAVEMNVLVATDGRYAFRHALLGEAVYDDLLPGERVRLHAAYAQALGDGRARGTAAELARHARLAMDLGTALSASIQAGNEARAVGGPDEAAQHYQQALELLADPRRAADVDFDLSKLVVATAEALISSGHPERAAAVAREQLERLPDDAPSAWFARMLAIRATALTVIESDVDPAAVSAEALALVPDDAAGLRAKVLGIHARALMSMGRYEEAQAVGLDALEVAERLDLNELASDAITTLSGLKKAGPKEALRAALEDAVGRAVRAGALEAELRGRWMLGRSYEDWAEFEETERWFRSGIQRGTEAGVPWAPYAFEARWKLAWALVIQGDWDGALALCDVRDQAPPPIPKALLESVRLTVEFARGADVSAALAALRRFWPREGGVAIHAAAVGIRQAARRGDPAAVLVAYDDAVQVLTRIWHEWFSARIRLAAIAIESLVACLPGMSAAERATYLQHAERLHGDGHTVLDRYTDPSGFWGPEGRAWVQRLDAQLLRMRWLVGTDAPPLDVLVGTWREDAQLFEDFGEVHELARSRTALAGILRASGDLVAARELGDLARETAHRLEAQPLLDELRALGSTAARGDAASDTLTTREAEILALVAEGRSNGEIGKQLFISAKTVSVHVSNILGKLGASGRTEAAAIAHRRGLIG
jgi:DNA-binding CsgD family transcriptional regulator/tetratricopeptide (TPR) repeat protein